MAHRQGTVKGYGGAGGAGGGGGAMPEQSTASSSATAGSPYSHAGVHLHGSPGRGAMHSPSAGVPYLSSAPGSMSSSVSSALAHQLHARAHPHTGLSASAPPSTGGPGALPGQSPLPPSSPAATSSILPLRRGVAPLAVPPAPVSETQFRDFVLDGAIPFDACVHNIYSELLAILVRNVCIEQHKNARLGRLCLSCKHSCSDPLDQDGVDVFGQPIRKAGSAAMEKMMTLKCVNCSWTVAPSRYAPHLEKCMGLGRNSSRLASQRLMNISSETRTRTDMDVEDSDDEEYTDSGEGKRKNKSKKKKKKDPPPAMTKAKLEQLLATTCGVMSTSTGQMCSKSVNCPAHTQEQRDRLRETLLNPPLPDMPDTKLSLSTASTPTASASPTPTRADTLTASTSSVSSPGSAQQPVNLTGSSSAMDVEVPSEQMVYVDIEGVDDDAGSVDARKKGRR